LIDFLYRITNFVYLRHDSIFKEGETKIQKFTLSWFFSKSCI